MVRIVDQPAVRSRSSYRTEAEGNQKPPKCHHCASGKVKAATFIGSSASILLTLGALVHKAKKGNSAIKLSNFKFTELDVLKLGAASVIGGLTGGILSDEVKNVKPKLKEANIQFFGNILTPVAVLALANKVIKPENIKMPQIKESGKFASKLNPLLKGVPRIAVTIASLTGGLSLGNKIMNKVNEKVFREKSEREVKTSDFSAHIDDLCFASTFIFKAPAMASIMSKILPATFLIAGMETGTKAEKCS